ncbi:MAG: hypothetical protein C0401_06435 [Anaerolinea sp.]|nr:hypothetical protein [Anaerolinea sp.]
MKINIPTVESIEEYIIFLNESIGQGVSNMPPTDLLDPLSIKSNLEQLHYSEFILFADYHYFVSRTLFMNFVRDYSFFSGYQCMENYLKAYIKSKNCIPSFEHPLNKLLKICREFEKRDDAFIFSKEIETIFYKFDPYYMVPRYPITSERWVSRTIDPFDINLLDYFVLRFREILPLPQNQMDLLKGDHIFLTLCKKYAPNFYLSFFNGNINFTSLSNNIPQDESVSRSFH